MLPAIKMRYYEVNGKSFEIIISGIKDSKEFGLVRKIEFYELKKSGTLCEGHFLWRMPLITSEDARFRLDSYRKRHYAEIFEINGPLGIIFIKCSDSADIVGLIGKSKFPPCGF